MLKYLILSAIPIVLDVDPEKSGFSENESSFIGGSFFKRPDEKKVPEEKPPEDCKPCKGSLPSARKCLDVRCPPVQWGGAVSLTFLMWQPRQDELEFAVKGEDGKRVGVDFDWSPGFKVDLDLQFPNRAWDFDVRWTVFYNRSTGSYSGQLLPLWILPNIYPSFNSYISYGNARAVWKAHMNAIDLELGYDPMLTKNLSFRLICGVKAFSLFQHLTIDYTQGVLNGVTEIAPSRCGLRTESLAIGPRLGFNSSWRLGGGWSLLGDFSGSLMLDYFVMKRKDADNALIFSEGIFRENFYAFRPALEALTGICWDGCFGAKKGLALSFQAAYEIQTYWEQNMVSQVVARELSYHEFNVRGDFAVQGVSLKVSVGF